MEEEKLIRRKKRAGDEGNLELMATCSRKLAQFYYREERYEEALKEYKEEARLYSILEKPIEVAVAHRMIGEVYSSLGEYEKAIEHQNKHLGMARQQNNEIEEQRALATIGRTYFCMAESIADKDDSKYRSVLAEAKKAYLKSLNVCEKLKGVSKIEVMQMRSRLLLNLGLVLECQDDVAKGIEYIEKIYFSQGDFQAAKHTLLKAYKLRSPNASDRKSIEKNLKTAVALCRTEEKLRNLEDTDFKNRKKLYEIMGDGCVAVKNFDRALVYYHKMLECAEKLGDSDSNLAAIYVSLSQTYKDKKDFDRALEFSNKELQIWQNNPAEACKTMLTMAQLMEMNDSSYEELEEIHEKARGLAKLAGDKKLEATVLRSLYEIQKTKDRTYLAEKTKQELELNDVSEDEDSDANTEEQETPDIGDDVSLSGISDSENEEYDRPRTTRKRSHSLRVRRNEKGETQLHTACISGNKPLVKRLLDQGHPVNVRDHCGWLPLHEACNLGFPEIVELLLDNGAAINDRGGALCGGVSPLHDAALCGNLTVVQILLDRGASVVARTNEGKTPLDCLLEWRSQTDELEPSDLSLFVSIERQLRRSLEKAGCSIDNTAQVSTTVHTDKKSEAHCSSRNTVGRNKSSKGRRQPKPGNINLRRQLEDSDFASSCHRRNHSPDRGSDSDSSAVVSSSVDVRTTNITSPYSWDDKEISSSRPIDSDLELDSNDATSAREEYQRVICGLRTRTVQDTSSGVPNKMQTARRKGSFLSPEEVGDDWLEDDLGSEKRPTKRKRTEAERSGLLGSSLRQGQSANQAQFANEDVTKMPSPEPATEDTEIDIFEDNYHIEEIMSQASAVREQQNSGRVHSQRTNRSQPSLLDIGFSRNLEHATAVPSITPHQSVPVSHTVRVRVEDKKLLIPVPSLDSSIGWLAAETSRRYYNLEGLQPSLSLLTSDGALLAQDDPVSLVVGSEEIVASVISWNLPPLTERYMEAATSLNTAVDSHLHNLLEICQATQNLELEDLALPVSSLSAVFRALRYQNTLQSLHLSGNHMNDEGVKLLATCITTMPQLKELDLSCNNISAVGLSHLSNQFSPGTSPPLQALSKLNLSCNPLGPTGGSSLGLLLSSLPSLSSLDLHACSLCDTPEGTHLCLDNLEELDISYNDIGHEGVRTFLGRLSVSKIVTLNVAKTQVNSVGGHSPVAREVVIFLDHSSIEPENLRTLNLSGCNVRDTDVWELIRPLQKAAHLECLILRDNAAITSVSLRRLLQLCPHRLDLSGCSLLTVHLCGANPANWIPPAVTRREIVLSADTNTLDWGPHWEVRRGPGGLVYLSAEA